MLGGPGWADLNQDRGADVTQSVLAPQGKEFQMFSAEGSLPEGGPARDMSLCGLGQKHVTSREEGP